MSDPAASSGASASHVLGGRIALVVGGASGIGLASALAFGEAGARVVVADMNGDAARSAASRLGEQRALALTADVRDDASVAAMVRATLARFGRLDIAVNAAGVGGVEAMAADYPPDDWSLVVDVNLTGCWRCMRHQLTAIMANEPRDPHATRGSIVNVASTAGLNGFPRHAAYTASKHGVVGLTRAAALEYARHGIRINAVCPGFTDTPMVELMTLGEPARQAKLVARVPARRLADSEEIADAILYLASDAASFVIGHALAIDGGVDAM